MASELQRRKIAGVFTAMDADADGHLDAGDFAALAARWSGVRVAGDPGRLSEVMLGWWATLVERADLNRDGRASMDEVLKVVDQLPGMPEAVTATADAMFEAVDENGDGLISADEYRTMIEAWNGNGAAAGAIFPLLDAEGDGRLSREEFTALWLEFWAGDDPGAPGTLVFGPLP